MLLSDLKTWLDSQLGPVTHSQEQLTLERGLLLQYTLGISPTMAYANPDHRIDTNSPQYIQLQKLLSQRCEERLPIQYLLQHTLFMGQRYSVSPEVLIPRPETELLVEHAIALCLKHNYANAVDLGTGSGCIAIALQKAIPSLSVTATDTSQAALAVAQHNAEEHQTAITFKQGDWFSPLTGQSFDLILSNPPYIAPEDRATLQAEVLHEPELALFSPSSPGEVYDTLLQGIKTHLTPQGRFLLELGHQHGAMVTNIAQAHGFHTQLLDDLSHVPRFLMGQRSPLDTQQC